MESFSIGDDILVVDWDNMKDRSAAIVLFAVAKDSHYFETLESKDCSHVLARERYTRELIWVPIFQCRPVGKNCASKSASVNKRRRNSEDRLTNSNKNLNKIESKDESLKYLDEREDYELTEKQDTVETAKNCSDRNEDNDVNNFNESSEFDTSANAEQNMDISDEIKCRLLRRCVAPRGAFISLSEIPGFQKRIDDLSFTNKELYIDILCKLTEMVGFRGNYLEFDGAPHSWNQELVFRKYIEIRHYLLDQQRQRIISLSQLARLLGLIRYKPSKKASNLYKISNENKCMLADAMASFVLCPHTQNLMIYSVKNKCLDSDLTNSMDSLEMVCRALETIGQPITYEDNIIVSFREKQRLGPSQSYQLRTEHVAKAVEIGTLQAWLEPARRLCMDLRVQKLPNEWQSLFEQQTERGVNEDDGDDWNGDDDDGDDDGGDDDDNDNDSEDNEERIESKRKRTSKRHKKS